MHRQDAEDPSVEIARPVVCHEIPSARGRIYDGTLVGLLVDFLALRMHQQFFFIGPVQVLGTAHDGNPYAVAMDGAHFAEVEIIHAVPFVKLGCFRRAEGLDHIPPDDLHIVRSLLYFRKKSVEELCAIGAHLEQMGEPVSAEIAGHDIGLPVIIPQRTEVIPSCPAQLLSGAVPHGLNLPFPPDILRPGDKPASLGRGEMAVEQSVMIPQ